MAYQQLGQHRAVLTQPLHTIALAQHAELGARQLDPLAGDGRHRLGEVMLGTPLAVRLQQLAADRLRLLAGRRIQTQQLVIGGTLGGLCRRLQPGLGLGCQRLVLPP